MKYAPDPVALVDGNGPKPVNETSQVKCLVEVRVGKEATRWREQPKTTPVCAQVDINLIRKKKAKIDMMRERKAAKTVR